MTNRILKDIRIFESAIENVAGSSLPSHLETIFKPTENINYIAKRIARKLNELAYSFGEPDHIYINLTPLLTENAIEISNRDVEKWMKYINFGVIPAHFNALKNEDKDVFIQKSILTILAFISNKNNLHLVQTTAKQISEFGAAVKIHYKTKETKSYRIAIYYQIAPFNKLSNAIIDYYDKKSGATYTKNFELKLYEDIYSLIDKIVVKDNKINLKPKKSFRAALVTKYYKTPIEIELE